MLLDRTSTKIKLIDFGLARKINDKDDVRAMMGTAEFIGNDTFIFLVYSELSAEVVKDDAIVLKPIGEVLTSPVILVVYLSACHYEILYI